MNSLALLCGLLLSFSALSQSLSELIPYPFFVEHKEGENHVMVIENGLAALQLRLDLIKRAQKSIEIESYIYKTDEAGKLVTLELKKASERGVKVRILVDKSIIVTELNEKHARRFKQIGIELRYYHDETIFKPLAANFRNHRKLLVVDDLEAITGGRNIGNDYFHMDEDFNYNDRDMYVIGPVAKTMRETFDLYFNNNISHEALVPADEEDNTKIYFVDDEKIQLLRDRVELLARPVLDKIVLRPCPLLTFVSDAPGLRGEEKLKKDERTRFRYLRQVIFDRIKNATKAITLTSPYMIFNKQTRELMDDVTKRKIELNLHTNSLASTDAIYMIANAYLKFKKWSKAGANIYLHKGRSLDGDVILNENAESARWGLHDKSQVYESLDSSEVMIGSYNIDNRSYLFNSELALFCKNNQELTQEVKGSIMGRAQQGLIFMPDGTAQDKNGRVNVYGASKEKILLMKLFTLPSYLIRYFL